MAVGCRCGCDREVRIRAVRCCFEDESRVDEESEDPREELCFRFCGVVVGPYLRCVSQMYVAVTGRG